LIDNPQNKSIPQYLWDMVDKLLLEKIQIAGISRVTGILEPWLQRYINRKYARVPHAIDRSKKRPSHGRVMKCGRLLKPKATDNGSG